MAVAGTGKALRPWWLLMAAVAWLATCSGAATAAPVSDRDCWRAWGTNGLRIEACTQIIARGGRNLLLAKAYFTRGLAYAQDGRYGRAIFDYTQAILIDRNDAAAYFNRGISRHKSGDLDRAIADYDEALRLDPDNVKVYYYRGRSYEDKGQADRAVEDYRKVLARLPNYQDAIRALKRVQASGARKPPAAADNRPAATADKRPPASADKKPPTTADKRASGSLSREQQLAEFENCFFRGVFDKDFTDAGQVRGCIAVLVMIEKAGTGRAARQRKFEALLRAYSESLKSNPNVHSIMMSMAPEHYHSIYFERGHAYRRLGLYDLAIADFDAEIRLAPNYAPAYVGRGSSYVERDKTFSELAGDDAPRALADFNRAIKLSPKYSNAYVGRGQVYASEKKYRRALANFNKAMRLGYDLPDVYQARGAAYLALHRYRAALADTNMLVQLKPKSSSSYEARGAVYKAKHDYDRAIADFTRAIEFDPESILAYMDRMDCYYAKGDKAHGKADEKVVDKMAHELLNSN